MKTPTRILVGGPEVTSAFVLMGLALARTGDDGCKRRVWQSGAHRVKLKASSRVARWYASPIHTTIAAFDQPIPHCTRPFMFMKFLMALFALLLLPAIADAADITGVPKIREAITSRSAMPESGSAASTRRQGDQLCLNAKGERWTCGAAARDELIKHADTKTWTCHTGARSPTAAAASWRAATSMARTSRNGWSATAGRCPGRGLSHDYERG